MASTLSTAPSLPPSSAIAAQAIVEDDEKSIRISHPTSPDQHDDVNDDLETNAQEGVKTVEGITKAWNKKWLAIAYIW